MITLEMMRALIGCTVVNCEHYDTNSPDCTNCSTHVTPWEDCDNYELDPQVVAHARQRMYAQCNVDDPCMFTELDPAEHDNPRWVPGHFAGISKNGDPLSFVNGCTSWTTDKVVAWVACRKPYDEELRTHKECA